MSDENIVKIAGIHVAYNCHNCGARDSAKPLQEKTCPRCGVKYTFTASAEAVIISGPTKEKDKDGYWRPKAGGEE